MNQQEATRQEDNANRALDAMCRLLERFFHERVPREESIAVGLLAGAPQPDVEDTGMHAVLQFALPDGTPLQGALRVQNAGGNVYEVEAGIKDSPSQRFTISLPEATDGGDAHYGEAVCRFLLAEVERTAGEMTLRETSRRKQAS